MFIDAFSQGHKEEGLLCQPVFSLVITWECHQRSLCDLTLGLTFLLGHTSIPSGITCRPSLSSHLPSLPNCPLLSLTSSYFLMLPESHSQSVGLTRGTVTVRHTPAPPPNSLIKPRSFYFSRSTSYILKPTL